MAEHGKCGRTNFLYTETEGQKLASGHATNRPIVVKIAKY